MQFSSLGVLHVGGEGEQFSALGAGGGIKPLLTWVTPS